MMKADPGEDKTRLSYYARLNSVVNLCAVGNIVNDYAYNWNILKSGLNSLAGISLLIVVWIPAMRVNKAPEFIHKRSELSVLPGDREFDFKTDYFKKNNHKETGRPYIVCNNSTIVADNVIEPDPLFKKETPNRILLKLRFPTKTETPFM